MVTLAGRQKRHRNGIACHSHTRSQHLPIMNGPSPAAYTEINNILNMDKKHRKTLIRNRLTFVKDLEASDVTGYLYESGIITENDKETVESHKTRRERVEYLLDLLPRKGPNAFLGFCDVLSKSSYGHLRDGLQSNLEKNTDCVDGVTRLKQADIRIRPRSGSKREPDMLNCYPMTSNPRGWCFIVNNMNFFTMSDRCGSERDAANLQSLFTLLGYRVWILQDADTDEIREKFTELANKLDHTDSLVVCVLSHGISGKIYGVEGSTIAVAEILDILSEGQSGVLLKGKPKLFLIQACRSGSSKSSKRDNTKKQTISSAEVISTPSGTTTLSEDKPSEEKELSASEKQPDIRDEKKSNRSSMYESFVEQNTSHLHSDMLLGYSTFPGEVSWRNTTHGSFYIDSVVEVFSEYASSEDVFSMLIKVNEKVFEKVSEQGQDQIPAPVVTLTKKLYLLPVQK